MTNKSSKTLSVNAPVELRKQAIQYEGGATDEHRDFFLHNEGKTFHVLGTTMYGKLESLNANNSGLYNGGRYPYMIRITSDGRTNEYNSVGQLFEYQPDQLELVDTQLLDRVREYCADNPVVIITPDAVNPFNDADKFVTIPKMFDGSERELSTKVFVLKSRNDQDDPTFSLVECETFTNLPQTINIVGASVGTGKHVYKDPRTGETLREMYNRMIFEFDDSPANMPYNNWLNWLVDSGKLDKDIAEANKESE